MTRGSIVRAYLRDQRREIFLIFGVIAVFLLIGFLCNAPMDALLYAALLAAVVSIVSLAADGCRYARTHRKLEALFQETEAAMQSLPPSGNLIESDYQTILRNMDQLRRRIVTEQHLAARDMADYYGMWVHQIKTPIAAMHLSLQIAQSKHPEESCFRELSAELFKIEQYAEMVLTYLRTESMSEDLSFRRISLDDCIRQAIRKYANLFILEKIRLEFQEGHLTILTDEKWLVFVLEQLISNALKYTREGGSISISSERKDGRLLLTIRDTGIGIQASDLPRIFEKGFTGYNGRNDKKASGIGLYLVKRILDKLQASITITSEVRVGTCVTLDLTKDDEILTTM